MNATDLGREKYINIESYKRDGGGVKTPVWVAPLEGNLVVFTLGDSYKVKRVGRNPKVKVAACDVRGNVRGPWVEGKCVIVDDPAREALAYAALREKYGMVMKMGDFFSKLSGRIKRRKVLEISLDALHPIMRIAVTELERISSDPDARRIAADRERDLLAHGHFVASARRQGRDEGREEGLALGKEEGLALGQLRAMREAVETAAAALGVEIGDDLRGELAGASIDELRARLAALVTQKSR